MIQPSERKQRARVYANELALDLGTVVHRMAHVCNSVSLVHYVGDRCFVIDAERYDLRPERWIYEASCHNPPTGD